ncbi:MAG: endonuclease VII domain-containing protein [Actinomycetota bacterium]|nr:endonuclease VII domain-containing protein [Actinomycetota bacterium]
MPARGRRAYFRRAHGLGQAELEELRRAQDNRCAICFERDPQHVDHDTREADHATGRVRGLLCFRCNVALGHMRDRPAILRRGAAYLEGTAWQPIPSAPGVYPLPS